MFIIYQLSIKYERVVKMHVEIAQLKGASSHVLFCLDDSDI